LDSTTATDSLGIVTLATAAFKQGRLDSAQVQVINACADDFTRVLSLANKYRQVTGKSFPLDDIPSPSVLRRHLELGAFGSAMDEAAAIKKRMDSVFDAVGRQFEDLGLSRPVR